MRTRNGLGATVATGQGASLGHFPIHQHGIL
jgi:hypothetical protein